MKRKAVRLSGSSQNVYLTKRRKCDKIERLSQRKVKERKQFINCLLDKSFEM